MDFVQRCLSTGISTLKQIFAVHKKRLFTILFMMNLAALVVTYCGMVQLLWPQWAEDVPQICFSGDCRLQSLWLRNEVPCLDVETNTTDKPVVFLRHCWTFQVSRSEMMIRVPAEIPLKSVTMQLSSERASPLETASSAPQDLDVCGLDEESLLGIFNCTPEEKPHQSLPLQNEIPRALQLTNPGNWSSSGKPGESYFYRVQAMGKMIGRWYASLDSFLFLFSSIKMNV